MSTETNILILPDELLQEICLHLDWNSIFRTIYVSSKFLNLLKDDQFWKVKYTLQFGQGSPLITDYKHNTSPKYKVRFEYANSWKPETWQQRYRRVILARECNSCLTGNRKYFVHLNRKGKILVKYIESKKFCFGLPSRAIAFNPRFIINTIIMENGQLCYIFGGSSPNSFDDQSKIEWQPFFHNLIKTVSDQSDSNTSIGYITDNLSGYLSIHDRNDMIKLPILVRNMIIEKDIVILLGQDRQIYLYSLGETAGQRELLEEIEFGSFGHLYKVYHPNQSKTTDYRQIILHSEVISALTLDGQIFRFRIEADMTSDKCDNDWPDLGVPIIIISPGERLQEKYISYKLFSKKEIQIQQKVVRIVSFDQSCAAITENGELYIWNCVSRLSYLIQGEPDPNLGVRLKKPTKVRMEQKVKDILINEKYIVISIEDGTISCKFPSKIACSRCKSANICIRLVQSRSADIGIVTTFKCLACQVEWKA